MIEHIWSLICSNCIINSDTNNLSLIEVLEQINLPNNAEFPLVIGNPFFVVTLWSRADPNIGAKGRATIRVKSHRGKITEFPEQEINLDEYQRARNRTGFQGLNVIEPGTYIFEVILVNDGMSDVGKTVSRLPLLVQTTSLESH